MSYEAVTLQRSDKEFDGEIVTTNWPLPAPRAWNSARKPSLWERFCEWMRAIEDPFVGTGVDD